MRSANTLQRKKQNDAEVLGGADQERGAEIEISVKIGSKIRPWDLIPSPAYMFQFDARCMKNEASEVRNPHQELKPNERLCSLMLTESLPKTAKTRIQWNSEIIYKYNRKIEHILKRLESSKHYSLAESFVVALKLSGLSLGRVYYYSNRLGKIIEWFEKNNIDPRNVTTDQLSRCLANLLEPRYSGETKRATAHTLKRFVNYAKTGEMKEEYALLLFKKYASGKGIDIRVIGKGSKEAFNIVDGHPFYLMSLAEDWDGERNLHDVYRESLSSSTGRLRLYVEYVLAEDIGEAQGGPLLRTILRLLASKGAMSIGAIANALEKPATYMVPYINELLKFDLLIKQDKMYKIRDRVVQDYLKTESEELGI